MRTANTLAATMLISTLALAQTPQPQKLVVGDQDAGVALASRKSGLNIEMDAIAGVDFQAYLTGLLARVKESWTDGSGSGLVVIQLNVNRDGLTPKLTIVFSSVGLAKQKAAVAAIANSVPFAPLPADFTGDRVSLRFSFVYGTTGIVK